ncbi:MAG: beta-propeller fold lactonase family protein [Pirellula sp.]|jgi:DNA-binding beta-propeller fold protein YncE|nr:beta-propeller fold lactonase family protein [Pirellula sp.]
MPSKYLPSLLFASFAFIIVPAICIGRSLGQERALQPQVQLPGFQGRGETLLPNGWTLKPVGTQIELGDFPSRMKLSPDGRFAAVLHTGWGTHEVRMVLLEDGTVTSSVAVDQAYQGLCFSPDGKRLYVSRGEDEAVYVYDHRDGYLTLIDTMQLVDSDQKSVVAGLATTLDGKQLLVCGLLSNQLEIIDLVDRVPEIRLRNRTPNEAQPDRNARPRTPVTPKNVVGSQRIELPKDSFPVDVAVTPDGKRAMVSLWGAASVAVVDLESKSIVSIWPVRSHPTEMLFLDNGKHLLVGCTDDSSIVMLDAETGAAKEVITTALYASRKNGSTPNSIAVSPDGNVLIAANADNNNVAVFDIRERGQTKSLGFIPVGWYPTAVAMTLDGEQILVANGKGLTSRDNRRGPNPLRDPPRTTREYIGGLFKGTLSIIPNPDPATMAEWTKDAYACSPFKHDSDPNLRSTAADSVIPSSVGDPCPIKHCFYIIKENRTYDQVFGDMDKGNGDPELCIFPERVTPNHHALAREFVLLDNFYVESEVSADGHEWTMAAYATDFVERGWPLSYRGGRNKIGYTSEGAYEIAAPSSGYFWDQCKKAGVSYYSFGEFIENGKTPNDPGRAKVATLEGHFDPMYRSYDLDYMDIDRAKRFAERLAQFDREDNLPQFIVLRIGNDHTSGTRVGKKTPTAMVADNDLALGQIVETISNSRYWNSSAIFVVEDDAQNGSDHVDAHRTVALAISPYIRKGTVDSTLYTTSSMLRTMELILGLEPMTQFDAAANPMYGSFGKTADPTPYRARQAQVDLYETNNALAWGAEMSEKLDLSKEDAADDLLLGEIVWRSVRGANSPMPPPVRAAFVFAEVEEEEEEE